MGAITEACQQIRSSRGFIAFLELTLLAGNYLAASTKNAKPCYGFQLQALNTLSTTKTQDGTHTLLYFLIVNLDRKGPELAAFAEKDWKVLAQAVRFDLNDIEKTVRVYIQYACIIYDLLHFAYAGSCA